MSHANARLTPRGRLILVERIAGGWPVSRAAAAAGISRQTGSKWWNRYRREGKEGLFDRRSRVHPRRIESDRRQRHRPRLEFARYREPVFTGLPQIDQHATVQRRENAGFMWEF